MKDNRYSESDVTTHPVKIAARNVQVYYGDSHAIRDVDIDINDKTVTAFIGPSGCGQPTFPRIINSLTDTIVAARVSCHTRIDVDDRYGNRLDRLT